MELNSLSNHGPKKGMVLPFQPLSLAFNNVNYYVDMPAVSNRQSPSVSLLQMHVKFHLLFPLNIAGNEGSRS